MSKAAIMEALGPRAAATLHRNLGGAGIYVAMAKPNYSSLTDRERVEIRRLYWWGYFAREIGVRLGRSAGAVMGEIGHIPSWERLPWPSSTDGKGMRMALREIERLGAPQVDAIARVYEARRLASDRFAAERARNPSSDWRQLAPLNRRIEAEEYERAVEHFRRRGVRA